MNEIQIHNKKFAVFLRNAEIEAAIADLAQQINADYSNKNAVPLFLSVLNGSFMFAAQLMKHIEFPCEISFVKLASYRGERSTAKVTELIGISELLANRHIIVVEDIVDTGNTYESLLQTLQKHSPQSIKMATLLLKSDVYCKSYPIDYAALRIPNDFIVGYGLDYNGQGRNLPDIYKVV
jgi:hypoxanthine phosphoribosyltransferase